MAESAIVTTGRKAQEESVVLAQKTAEGLGLPYVKRENRPLPDLKQEYGVSFVLVAKQGLLRLETPGGELFFHPNMAHLRIKNIRQGQGDRMVEAMGLEPGMQVLDCTLGMGADSIVASFVSGEKGKVTGLEVNPLLAAVIADGFQHFSADQERICTAMRRIEVVNENYLDYLNRQPDHSVDIVYFDPMFRHPLQASSALQPLREIADHRPVSAEAIAAACRVARHRVVLKENSRSKEFSRLGCQQIVGGKYSPIHYGVWMV